jgi:hypothetical protein
MPPETPRELPARRGFSVLYRGKTLLSRIDPVALAERTAGEIPVKDRTLYFCPSPLYGYGLDVLLKRLGHNSAVLCVEEDAQLFDLSLRAFGGLPAERSGNGDRPLALVRAADPGALCAFVRRTWGERRFRRVETLRLTGGWQLAPRLYENLAAFLRRDMAVSWGNAMTLIKLGRLYTRNAIRNLALFPEHGGISDLDFGAAPMLVLGAGPSLDGVLRGLLDRFGGEAGNPQKRPFRIICADTCIPSLSAWGIRPDLAVILESQHWNLGDFVGGRGRGIPVAMDLSALPASGRVLGGPVFLFATPWTELRLFGRLETAGLFPSGLAPLGSVGLTAAAIALKTGSGPVLTGGIDFSFTLDSYHARSSPSHLSRLAGGNRFRSLLNAAAAFRKGAFACLAKNGLPVRSDPAMRGYRDLFEREFSGEKRLRDISGPGLPLGIKSLAMDEALEVLAGGGGFPPFSPLIPKRESCREALRIFMRGEEDRLIRLRELLSGGASSTAEEPERLLDECDYLWAHFPECAGAGGRRPPAEDISFLKRVRAEIDPFLRLWDFSRSSIC